MPHILIFSISPPFRCPFRIQDCFRLVSQSCSIDYVFLLHTVYESSQLWLNSKILCAKNFQNISQLLDSLLIEECFFFCNYYFFNFFLLSCISSPPVSFCSTPLKPPTSPLLQILSSYIHFSSEKRKPPKDINQTQHHKL